MPIERKRSRDNDDVKEDRRVESTDDHEIREFEKMLWVDKTDLDTVLESLGDVFYRVSKRYTIALSLADEAKAYIEEVEAELDAQIRKQALENEEKVSETGIKQRIQLMPKMQRAIKDHLDKRRSMALWLALKESFSQRSYAIKELVSLYGQEYFEVSGVVRAKRETTASRAERAIEARNKEMARRRSEDVD